MWWRFVVWAANLLPIGSWASSTCKRMAKRATGAIPIQERSQCRMQEVTKRNVSFWPKDTLTCTKTCLPRGLRISFCSAVDWSRLARRSSSGSTKMANEERRASSFTTTTCDPCICPTRAFYCYSTTTRSSWNDAWMSTLRVATLQKNKHLNSSSIHSNDKLLEHIKQMFQSNSW